MTVEHELDTLVQQMTEGLKQDPNARVYNTYTRSRTNCKIENDRHRRTPSEEARFNRDQWYGMATSTQQASSNTAGQRSLSANPPTLTPILKRRDPLSPGSLISPDSSSGGKARKQLNFSLDSDRVSGYESDRSPSPRPRSASPHRFHDPVAKADYYRHKDSRHIKPLPGQNAYMGSSWPKGLDQPDQWESPRRSRIYYPAHDAGAGSGRSSSQSDDGYRNRSPTGFGTAGRNVFGGSQQNLHSPSAYSSSGGGGGTGVGGDDGFGDDSNLVRSSENLSGSCQDIDRKGRFVNLPSNWEKSIKFFEQKREELPAQRIKSVEPLNAYVRTEPVKVTESTANLLTKLQESSRENEIPAWMRGLKHIVIEQVPLPVPPRFGTLVHGRRNPDASQAAPIHGPPCHLCRQPITESRCIRSDEHNFHCWHFVCSFCNKTLQEFDFTMAPDNRPYCLNCFKRYFP